MVQVSSTVLNSSMTIVMCLAYARRRHVLSNGLLLVT
jgi:hypothetical protein